MTDRTPEQIIGKDRLLQLIFEGYAVVRREPTQGMRIAGHAALDASPYAKPGVGAKVGFAALGDVWRAMIADGEDGADK